MSIVLHVCLDTSQVLCGARDIFKMKYSMSINDKHWTDQNFTSPVFHYLFCSNYMLILSLRKLKGCLLACLILVGHRHSELVGSLSFPPTSPTTHLHAQCGIEEKRGWQRRIGYIVSYTLGCPLTSQSCQCPDQ